VRGFFGGRAAHGAEPPIAKDVMQFPRKRMAHVRLFRIALEE
jgi:hypothetical protein